MLADPSRCGLEHFWYYCQNVPILDDADFVEVKRLLELFPISKIRGTFPDVVGTKDEIATVMSDKRRRGSIAGFVDQYFSTCKEHVYIFSGEEPQLPASIPGGERVHRVRGGHSLYVAKVQYHVVIRDPLVEDRDKYFDFLWPIRMEVMGEHLVVRFVTLEKNLSAYVDVPHLVASKSLDEEDVLATLKGVTRTDIHKGIKHLWHHGFMDCSRARYKKPKSVAWEAMDEQKGIKSMNPNSTRY